MSRKEAFQILLKGFLHWLGRLIYAFLVYPEKSLEDNQTRNRQRPRGRKTLEELDED